MFLRRFDFEMGSKLQWLFAETLVIVLGILLALALDGWWTERQEQALVIDYLGRLEDDVRSDMDYIESVWNVGLERKRNALERVLPIIRKQQAVPDDVYTFLNDVSLAGVMSATPRSWLTTTTFTDLRDTGNFRLIKDTQFRNEIADYFNQMNWQIQRTNSRYGDYVEFVHGIIPGELRSDITPEALDEFGVDFALSRILSDEFRVIANHEYNLMLFMERAPFERQINGFLDRLEQYRQQLEAE